MHESPPRLASKTLLKKGSTQQKQAAEGIFLVLIGLIDSFSLSFFVAGLDNLLECFTELFKKAHFTFSFLFLSSLFLSFSLPTEVYQGHLCSHRLGTIY